MHFNLNLYDLQLSYLNSQGLRIQIIHHAKIYIYSGDFVTRTDINLKQIKYFHALGSVFSPNQFLKYGD